MKTQVIITGVSGSGKTTAMRLLLDKFPSEYSKPLQYTTRKPRGDYELDEYVFLSSNNFLRKLRNQDFIEYVEYNKELYAIGRYFDENKSNIFIVEPVGREALKKYFRLNNIPFISVYLEVDKDEVAYRLEGRGESVLSMKAREKDFLYFHPSQGDIVIDGMYREEAVALAIHKAIQGAS